MIARESINEILERANILDIVSESVALKRQGHNFVGLCPFHSEKSPSFHVHESEQYYHCFGCGVSGNVIDYVMRSRGLSFPDAVEELAARLGVSLQRTGAPKDESGALQRQEIFKINALAQEFFRSELRKAPPEIVHYLQERGLERHTLDAYGVGFAPLQWRGLHDFLKSKKIPDEMLFSSGLVKRNSQGEIYDVFRGRIQFPVLLDGHRIAGFGGRLVPKILAPDNNAAPKYLNSPETPVYQKSKILFGLPQALQAARGASTIYLVEGYMDVLGLWQAGVKNVAATCGTAVTDKHIRRLANLVNRVVVLFDGDDAGRAAAGKVFPLFINSGIDVAAVFIPEGEDPDTIALKKREETDRYLEELPKIGLLHCYVDYLVAQMHEKSVEDLGAAVKGKLAEEVVSTLALVENPVEQGELMQQAALKLRIAVTQLATLLHKQKSVTGSALPKSPGLEQKAEEPSVTEVALTKGSGPAVAVQDLPRLDQELLRAIMSGKDEFAGRFLQDPDLCMGVEPITFDFVQTLHSILEESAGEEQKKGRIKALLTSFGPSWLQHWKSAFAMQRSAAVDMKRVFIECTMAVVKNKINQRLKLIDQQLSQISDGDRKAALLQEKLSIMRQSKEQARPN